MTYRFPQSREWFIQSMDAWLMEKDLWECKTISIRRDTRALASVSTRSMAIADQCTVTMPTDIATPQ